MDPADIEHLRSALTNQGILLGEHHTMLRTVVSSLQDLTAGVTQLHVAAAAATPPAQPVQAPAGPALAAREPHVPTPERYAGDLGACGRFLFQCNLVFAQQPGTFHSDQSRIAYIMSLLSGRAAQWVTALWESHHQDPVCTSLPVFTAELRKVFDHPVQGKEAASKLLSLRQGPRSVAEFSVDFRILAAESGWDETALRGVFVHGLSDTVKDELAARDETDSLDSLISLSIRLDNRLRERRREKGARPVFSPVFSSPNSLVPASRVTSETQPSSSGPVSSPSPLDREEPMQLGRARLTQAERQRRMRAGLCLYCGQAGHLIASCSLLPKE